MKALFTKHPHSMGETYTSHLVCAAIFGIKMVVAGFACITHAIFPFMFKDTGSNMIYEMMHTFIDRCPKPENRMIHLAQTLNEKIENEI